MVLFVQRRYVDGAGQQFAQQRRYAEHLTLRGQVQAGCGVGADVGVEHGHRAAHAHFVGHARRDPDGAVGWHHPVALLGEDGDHAAGGVGELPAAMGMHRKVLAIGIVVGSDHGVAGGVFVGVDVSLAHGPNLMIYDLIVQASHRAYCA